MPRCLANTAGGVAPAAGCDASHVGTAVQVPFSADYYFYRPIGRSGHYAAGA